MADLSKQAGHSAFIHNAPGIFAPLVDVDAARVQGKCCRTCVDVFYRTRILFESKISIVNQPSIQVDLFFYLGETVIAHYEQCLVTQPLLYKPEEVVHL